MGWCLTWTGFLWEYTIFWEGGASNGGAPAPPTYAHAPLFPPFPGVENASALPGLLSARVDFVGLACGGMRLFLAHAELVP